MTNLSVLPQLQNFCQLLVDVLRKQDFLTYFQKVSLVSSENGVVTLGVVSGFIRDNMSFRFSEAIQTAAKQVWTDMERVEIIVDENIDNPSYTQVIDCRKVFRGIQTKEKKEPTQINNQGKEVFSSRFDLNHFVVGPSNQLAYSACDAVVRKPGANYNPLFLYSEVGLGKTHLLQGTALEIKKKFPEKKIVYITSDQFVSEYVNAVKERKIDQMRARFRTIDVLLVDDIQFLAGKKGTQEEIYTLFNILYDAGKQIILSSDRPPKELTEIEPRLVSRFEWGIMVDIDAPDFETRLAILQQKAREKEFIVPQEVAEYIAYNLGRNVREIEGILNQMVAEYELDGRLPTIESISSRFTKLGIKHSHIGEKENGVKNILRSVSYEEVIKAVSDYFGVDADSILGDSRSRDLMIPRQVAMYLLKNKLRYTYERIGNIFNGREHSAVMYSCKKLETLLKKDQRLMSDIYSLREKLGV
ncbi:chromosomal replication initiator protein DnaA [Candidatus Gracilibacteria bacterium]|nr:chromosomal replication initiator protein DnaA [Candidatus Gracilibacteria bacterium]